MRFHFQLFLAAISVTVASYKNDAAAAAGRTLKQSKNHPPQPPMPRSDIVAMYYKPHYQCGEKPQTDPKQTARFVNKQLRRHHDFFGLEMWMGASNLDGTSNTIETLQYGVIGSVCGYDESKYQVPAALMYNTHKWSLVESLPKKSLGCNKLPIPDQPFVIGTPLPTYSGKFDQSVCADIVVPEGAASDNCCLCSYSKEEYDTGKARGYDGLGTRPFVAGLFKSKQDNKHVCVVSGEITHPAATQKLWNIDDKPQDWPYNTTVISWLCSTGFSLDNCFPNPTNSSLFYGSETLMSTVTSLCGSTPIIMMMDTNLALGVHDMHSMFMVEPFNVLTDRPDDSGTAPYTCCNDTGIHQHTSASDRIAVSGDALQIDTLEGGAVAPGGPLPRDLQYQCSSNEEHTPIRAHISFRN